MPAIYLPAKLQFRFSLWRNSLLSAGFISFSVQEVLCRSSKGGKYAAAQLEPSACILTIWDFMHHVLNNHQQHRQEPSSNLTPTFSKTHAKHSQLIRQPDPWIYRLSINKILPQFGIKPSKTSPNNNDSVHLIS